MFLIGTCFRSDLTKRNSFNYVIMYIPIGPSKKDLYKIIIGLLLVVYLIFLGMYKPKAETYSEDYGLNQVGLTYSDTTYAIYSTYSPDPNKKFFANKEGELVFSFYYAIDSTGGEMPYDVRVSDGTTSFQCSTGSYIFYNDSNTQRATINAVCNVNFNSNGWQDITISMQGYGKKYFLFSQYATYSSTSGAAQGSISGQVSSIFSTLEAFRIRTNEQLVDIWTKLEQIYNSLSSNNTTIQNIQTNTQNISDSLNDSSIDSSSANDLTSNSAFQDSNGLDAILKAPLNFIQSLTSSTCSSINLTIPYIDADVSLPCMSSIYTKALGQQLVNLIALVINGVVLYRYCLKILQLVHDAKNPNKDELEVLDL